MTEPGDPLRNREPDEARQSGAPSENELFFASCERDLSEALEAQQGSPKFESKKAFRALYDRIHTRFHLAEKAVNKMRKGKIPYDNYLDQAGRLSSQAYNIILDEDLKRG